MKQFEITDDDLKFYEKIGVPLPKLSPEERQRRRLMWCNEMNLIKRKCNLCGNEIFSMYGRNIKFPVYCQTCWWSDKWDPYSYETDFDFGHPFFEQYENLMNRVPHIALNVSTQNVQNSPYINYAGNAKNCHLIFDSDYNENCYYSYTINNSQNSSDCLKCSKMQWSYECIDCIGGYELFYSQNCINCSSSYFLKNCTGLKWCFGCVNLRHKEYRIFNKPVSKDAFLNFLADLKLDTWSGVQKQKQKALEVFPKFPNKYMRGAQNENCLGDSVFRSKNCSYCFDTYDARDCKYLHSISFSAQDCYDLYQFGENISQCYEDAIVGYGGFRVMFCLHAWPQNKEVYYSQEMRSCSNCFGCFGLKRGEYAIFNKSYKKDEYETTRARIIEHMKQTGEYGEFFPSRMSPFAYNETVAQDHFPLTKKEALDRGYRFQDTDPQEYQKQTYEIPDGIKDVPDSVVGKILACEETGKNFNIAKPELDLYKRLRIPIPRYSFETRHKKRLELRNPQKLWNGKCSKCGAEIKTSYAPEKKEIVYCEKCYLKTTY